MPAQKCLRLDKEKRLFPGSDHPDQEHQQETVGLPVCWSFDLATQNDQLLSLECVFREQFGSSSGQIGERAKPQ